MTTLYEIKENYRGLMDMELDAETMADTLEAIEGEFEVKAESICYVLANIDSDIDALDNEVKRLQARKKVLNNRKESLKDYLRENMTAIDKSKIETSLFTISRVKGRASALISDEALIPKQFQRITVSIDKTALLAELKNQPVEGAELTTSKELLRIK
jgi:chaperonin cofactor prefoldin